MLKKQPINLTIQIECQDKAMIPSKAALRRWIMCALFADAADYKMTATITLRFVGKRESRSLNAQFRNKDYATNVLTFPLNNHDNHIEGDLIFCVPVIQKEAEEQQKTVQAHFAHMVLHGVLHLRGYDHEHDAEAEIMEALEARLLAELEPELT